jgi:hypothetical protein
MASQSYQSNPALEFLLKSIKNIIEDGKQYRFSHLVHLLSQIESTDEY